VAHSVVSPVIVRVTSDERPRAWDSLSLNERAIVGERNEPKYGWIDLLNGRTESPCGHFRNGRRGVVGDLQEQNTCKSNR